MGRGHHAFRAVFIGMRGIYKGKGCQKQRSISPVCNRPKPQGKDKVQVNQSLFKNTEAQRDWLCPEEKNMEKAEENLRYADKGFKEGVIP